MKKDFCGGSHALSLSPLQQPQGFVSYLLSSHLALSSLVGGDGEPLLWDDEDFIQLFQLCALVSLNPLGSAMARS